VALRDLWRKVTRRGKDDKETDLRPQRDRLGVQSDGIVNTPPKSPGLEKPKY
jgi:hypothetical protein